MGARLERADVLIFKSICEFVTDDDLALASRNEEHLVILCSNLLILRAEYVFWGVQHCVHSLDDVVDYVLVVAHRTLQLFISEQMFGDVVVLNGLLEDLYGAENTVGLRDSPLHKFIKLILKSGCGIGSDEEFVNFSTEFV